MMRQHTYTPRLLALFLRLRGRPALRNVLDSIIEPDTVTIGDIIVVAVLVPVCEIGANSQQFARLVVNHGTEQNFRIRRPDGCRVILARKIGHHVHSDALGIEIMTRTDPGVHRSVVQHALIVPFPKWLQILHRWQGGPILHG